MNVFLDITVLENNLPVYQEQKKNKGDLKKLSSDLDLGPENQ